MPRLKLDALLLRLLADAEQTQATVESGAATAADWLAVETQQTRRDARSDLNLALKLGDHPILAAAMATGGVNPPQARAIVASLDRLPRTGPFVVSAEQRTAAEEQEATPAARHHRPQRSTRSHGQSAASQPATASASGRSRSALSARTQDCAETSQSSEDGGYR